MKLLTSIVTVLATLVALGAAAPAAAAVNVFDSCTSASSTAVCAATKNDNLLKTWTIVVDTITYFVGSVAVLMVIIGGFRYTISSGDSSAINAAKNTIIYALVGLVMAIMANGIVNFVLNQVFGHK